MIHLIWKRGIKVSIVLALILITLVVSSPRSDAHTLTAKGICTTLVWKTVAIGDNGYSGFHIHSQLQAMFDQNTGVFCNRIIGNVYLDVPPGGWYNAGTLDAYLTLYPNGTILHTAQCQTPANPNDYTNCLRWPGDAWKYEAGGPGNSIAIGDHVAVYVYGVFYNWTDLGAATNIYTTP